MCGICGFVTTKKIQSDILDRMNQSISHRGPDDRGKEIFEELGFCVGLGQVRLSIMDLSTRGHQPMFSHNRRYCIVYNGEIYNYKELNRLLKDDFHFYSTCDTETILAAYQKWGTKCVEYFNGMFAFVIYDKEKKTLFFARDRMGQKPLYYWKMKGQIVFASELKAIMEFPGFEKKINTNVLSSYFTNLYIAAPNTIFENVYKLEAGTCLLYSINEQSLTTEKYWDIWSVYKHEVKKTISTFYRSKMELKKKLQESIALRLCADVPVGVFLSGGYDSSLVAALAQEISDEPINTYCIGIEGQTDESVYAAQIAAHLGTRHTNYKITEADMLELVKTTPDYYDEPFADTSQIPSMLVSKLAKQDVTVILSGDGGDEFYGGYTGYIRIRRMQYLDILGGALYYFFKMPIIRKCDILSKLPYKVREIIKNRDPETKTQCGQGDMIERFHSLLKGAQVEEKFHVESQIPARRWDLKKMLLDMKYYITDDILQKVDRASMRYALEVRCPILDVNVIKLSFRIPHQFKIRGRQTKRILKELSYEYIPSGFLDRPKMGFGAPIDKWLRNPLKEDVIRVSRQEFLEEQGIFCPDKMQQFVDNYLRNGNGKPGSGEGYSYPIWAFYMFQLWWLKYCGSI